MTLVPIIYTSLIIFASLLFTVIIISYLSFKVKTRNRKQPSERIGVVHEVIIPKQIVLNGPKLDVNPIPVHYSGSARANYNDRIIAKDRRERKENYSYTQITDRRDPSRIKGEERQSIQRNERTSLRATRIEIMNESSSFRNISESNQESNHRNYNRDNIVEANLLNYYDNSTESDFVTMDTSLFRKAQ